MFRNNDDILNLVEMISRCAVVISPSTGIIHIASNMCVKTIGLYEKSESTKWRTKDNNYVFLKSPTSSLNKKDENIIIMQTMGLLKRILGLDLQ